MIFALLKATGMFVQVEGCVWRRFAGDLRQLAGGQDGRRGDLVLGPERALFVEAWGHLRAATFPRAPWLGADVVLVWEGAFNAAVARLAWMEHRLGALGLTAPQEQRARALAGELLDVLGGVPSSKLEEAWAGRLQAFGGGPRVGAA